MKNICYSSTPLELNHTRNNSTGYTCGYYCLIPSGFIPAHQNNIQPTYLLNPDKFFIPDKKSLIHFSKFRNSVPFGT